MSLNEMDGYILAGGLSRRMGRNKAVLRLGGKTFLDRAAATLSTVSQTVCVVGDLRGETSGLRVIPDDAGEARGAIVGLLAALRHAKTEWMAILACDLPFVSGDLIRRLAGIAESDPQAACIVPIQADGLIQPLCGLYRRRECLKTVEGLFRRGDWRLQDMFPRLNARLVRFDELSDLPGSENFFLNVNTARDYKAAIELYR